MTISITVTEKTSKQVKFLRAECGVRYWEDAAVNGEDDEDGQLIPCRTNDTWSPLIDLSTGTIQDWPAGTTAQVHYKVCDDGIYKLLSADMSIVASIDGYVPSIMSPGGSGYGDYVIMTIDGAGKIENWKVDLSDFEERQS